MRFRSAQENNALRRPPHAHGATLFYVPLFTRHSSIYMAKLFTVVTSNLPAPAWRRQAGMLLDEYLQLSTDMALVCLRVPLRRIRLHPWQLKDLDGSWRLFCVTRDRCFIRKQGRYRPRVRISLPLRLGKWEPARTRAQDLDKLLLLPRLDVFRTPNSSASARFCGG